MDPCPAHLDYEVEDGEQDFFAAASWACNAGEHQASSLVDQKQGGNVAASKSAYRRGH